MEIQDVPQEADPAYNGQRKAVYAKAADGRYTIVASSGWEVETTVTRQAVEALNKQAEDARIRCLRGEVSPLEYHMYKNRMDLLLLAQNTGIWRWRIRRHFNPAIFNKLPEKRLQQYAEVMGISTEQLRHVPHHAL